MDVLLKNQPQNEMEMEKKAYETITKNTSSYEVAC